MASQELNRAAGLLFGSWSATLVGGRTFRISM
jgi:hypothetical protein